MFLTAKSKLHYVRHEVRCCQIRRFETSLAVITSVRVIAKRIGATQRYQRSRHERKKVEMLFAHLKRSLKVDRLH